MKYINQQCLNYEVRKGINCLYSIFHNYSNIKGLAVSEADWFLISDGLELVYRHDINYFGFKSFSDYMTIINSKTDIQARATDCITIKDMEKYIRENKALILFINSSKSLTYHKVLTESLVDRRHVIILYGMDTEKDAAWIMDSFIKDAHGEIFTFSGEIKLSNLLGNIVDIGWINFDAGFKLERRNRQNLCMNNLHLYLKGKKKQNEVLGHSALRQYFEDLKVLKDLEGEELASVCNNIYFSLKITGILVALSYMNSLFQDEDIFNKSDIRLSSDELIDIESQWQNIAFGFYKMGRTKKIKELELLLEKAGKLTDRQNTVFSEILDRIRYHEAAAASALQ